MDLAGEYDLISLYARGDHFYFESDQGLINRLLPLDENQFMIPSRYGMLINVEKEEGNVIGIRIVWQNGHEQFFGRDLPAA